MVHTCASHSNLYEKRSNSPYLCLTEKAGEHEIVNASLLLYKPRKPRWRLWQPLTRLNSSCLLPVVPLLPIEICMRKRIGFHEVLFLPIPLGPDLNLHPLRLSTSRHRTHTVGRAVG